MARAEEKAAYEANAHNAQQFHDVSVVTLTDFSRLDKANDDPAAARDHRPDGDDPQGT